jgi:putative transposase
MPRPPRLDLPGVPQHMVVRGINRAALFTDDQDRCVFLGYLRDALQPPGIRLHAYVLMTNHVHMLGTADRPGMLSDFVQAIGRRFAPYANARQQRTGSLFEGRFHSSLVDTERYFLTCMRYIEMNPVRAGLVTRPASFPWSSFSENASGHPAGLLSPHDEYLRLGRSADERGAAYRALFSDVMGPETLAMIRACTRGNRPVGVVRVGSGTDP